jgi:hypothetical protein
MRKYVSIWVWNRLNICMKYNTPEPKGETPIDPAEGGDDIEGADETPVPATEGESVDEI